MRQPTSPSGLLVSVNIPRGLTTSDIQELTQWLVDRPMSVTVSKLNGYLKFLKCRRNIIWNICHPKNGLVAHQNSMFLCICYVFDIYGASAVNY